MNKKQILAKIKALLAQFPMLNLSCYENSNTEPAFSIFGFEAFTQAQLPQEAKDLILNIKKSGRNASYLFDNQKLEGSIYVGPSSAKATASDEDILNVL